MNIAICDDEVYYRDAIEKGIRRILQQKNMDDYQIDTWNSGEELCENQEKLKEYQVVFLDVEMNEMSGMEAARIIKSVNEKCYLVFVTAFIDYAMEGYKVEAIRYLLKDNLEWHLQECVETLLERLAHDSPQKIFVFREGKQQLFLKNILYVESDKHVLTFHVEGKEEQSLTQKGRLDEIQKELQPYGFIRIHKSFLVNMEHILLVKNYKVILKNKDELPVPREKFRQVKEEYLRMEAKV